MMEIERKFLVSSEWTPKKRTKSTQIIQGYLSKDKNCTVRVRISGKKAWVTIKGPTVGFSREEFEYSIPVEDAKKLLNLVTGPLIEKTRWTFKDKHGQQWEVDKFSGINNGLMVAEIELPSEDTPVILPSWVTEEVTYDKQYTNVMLSTQKAFQYDVSS